MNVYIERSAVLPDLWILGKQHNFGMVVFDTRNMYIRAVKMTNKKFKKLPVVIK